MTDINPNKGIQRKDYKYGGRSSRSFHEYKGYTIRLQAATGRGFSFEIGKYIPNANSPEGKKFISLRYRAFIGISSEMLLNKAMNYVNDFEPALIERFEKAVANFKPKKEEEKRP